MHVDQFIVVEVVLLRDDVVLHHEILFLMRIQNENSPLLELFRLIHLLHAESPEIHLY